MATKSNESSQQSGHAAAVWTVAISPDGTQLWSGANDGVLFVHDVGSGALLRSTQAHRGPILHIDLSGSAAATASRDRSVKIWAMPDGRLLHTLLSPHGGLFAVRQRGSRLALATFDDRVGVADTPSAPLRWFVGHRGAVTDVVWARDDQVVSASRDRTIMLWDCATELPIRTFAGHSHFVTHIACVARGDHVISASEDGTVRRWDLGSGELLWKATTSQRQPIWGMAVSADERFTAAGDASGFVRLFDAASGETLAKLGTPGLAHRALAFSPDSRLLAAGRDDGSVSVWDIATERVRITVSSASAGVISAARSGSRLFTGHTNGSVKALAPGAPTFPRHDRFVYTMRADTHRVVSGAFDGRVNVSDAATGALLQTFEHDFLVFSVSIDGRRVLVAGGETIRLWDCDSGALLRAPRVLESAVHAYAELLADADVVACVGESGVVRFWDMTAERCVGECAIGDDMPSAMAASRDGLWLAVATAYGTVTLIDCASRTVHWRVFALEDWIRDLRIVADTVLCVAQDGCFAALDRNSGAPCANDLAGVAVAALATEVGRDDVSVVDMRERIHPLPLRR